MRLDERSPGALILAVLSLGLLAMAFTSPWFYYEHSTNRQAPPDGPQGDLTGVERQMLEYYPDEWVGTTQASDVSQADDPGPSEPADIALADKAVQAMTICFMIAAGSMVLLALGEIPGLSLLLVRRVGITVAAIGVLAVGVALWIGWNWFPGSLQGYGVDTPFTAKMVEDGYIRTRLMIGYAYAAIAASTMFSAGLWKYGAGTVDPAFIERFRAGRKA